jgi:uncharacterized membrane protein
LPIGEKANGTSALQPQRGAIMSTLITAQDTWTLWGIILVGVAFSIYLEQTFRWAAKISGPVLALVMAMLLSNLRVVPAEAPAYDVVSTYLVPTAIPLLLFQASFVHIARTAGWMFVAFHIATLGTLIGCVIAAFLLQGSFGSVPEAAGIMAGSYIGGAINFFALKDTYQVSANITNPLLVADNFIMAGIFIVLLMIAGSKFFLRHYPHPHSRDVTQEDQALAAKHWERKEISLLDIAKALAVAFAISAMAQKLAGWIRPQIGLEMARSILGNPYVLITFLSVLVASLFPGPMRSIHGAQELGGYLLYVFLFVIGLPADLWQVIKTVPMMFVFCLIIAITNLALTLLLGRVFKLNLEDLLLSVNATIGGPPTAAAMAIARGWPKLVLPALLIGIWGYVIGTFLGIVVTETLRRVL